MKSWWAMSACSLDSGERDLRRKASDLEPEDGGECQSYADGIGSGPTSSCDEGPEKRQCVDDLRDFQSTDVEFTVMTWNVLAHEFTSINKKAHGKNGNKVSPILSSHTTGQKGTVHGKGIGE